MHAFFQDSQQAVMRGPDTLDIQGRALQRTQGHLASQIRPHPAPSGNDELLIGDGVARFGCQLLRLHVHARDVRVGLVHDA